MNGAIADFLSDGNRFLDGAACCEHCQPIRSFFTQLAGLRALVGLPHAVVIHVEHTEWSETTRGGAFGERRVDWVKFVEKLERLSFVARREEQRGRRVA